MAVVHLMMYSVAHLWRKRWRKGDLQYKIIIVSVSNVGDKNSQLHDDRRRTKYTSGDDDIGQ